MKYDIVHEGTVKEIMGNMVVVTITSDSTCGDCKVKRLCGMNEDAEKEVAVYDKQVENYNVGDTVVVGIGSVLAMKAVFWAYIAPFFLMMISLFATKHLGDLISGLVTLGIAAVYFICLYFMRNRLERDIIFKITKVQ